jgi:hypothetical protein
MLNIVIVSGSLNRWLCLTELDLIYDAVVKTKYRKLFGVTYICEINLDQQISRSRLSKRCQHRTRTRKGNKILETCPGFWSKQSWKGRSKDIDVFPNRYLHLRWSPRGRRQ